MQRFHTVWIIAVLLTFGSVALAYPTFNETGIVAQTQPTIAGSNRWDLRIANKNTMIIHALYGTNEQSTRPTLSVVDRICDPLKFKLAGGGSLSLAINLKGAVKVRYSIRF